MRRGGLRARAGALALLTAAGLLAGPVCGARAAIVNSLRGFAEEEPGWSGALAGSYGARGGNTEESTFEGSGRLQWRNEPAIWRLIAAGNRTTRGGAETARSSLAHLRHNYLLNQRWATLAFLQFQKNPFQKLESRFLLGLGGRWRAVKGKSAVLDLGAAHMFEQEKIQGGGGFAKAQRLSSFLSLQLTVREGVVIDCLVFYQPRWNDFGDWRIHGETKLEVALSDALSLFTGYNLDHNSRPPTGVDKTDWETRTGFAVKF